MEIDEIIGDKNLKIAINFRDENFPRVTNNLIFLFEEEDEKKGASILIIGTIIDYSVIWNIRGNIFQAGEIRARHENERDKLQKVAKYFLKICKIVPVIAVYLFGATMKFYNKTVI